MNTYGLMRSVTDEMRQTTAVDLDAMFAQEVRNAAIKAGYKPVAKAVIKWRRITELEHVYLRSDLEYPHAAIREGDWEVRATIEVA